MRAIFFLIPLVLGNFLGGFFANAHQGPEHEIEELSERMKLHGETADLLTERAVEYHVLGKLVEATADLERAAVLDPRSMTICRELGRVLFLAGKPAEGIAVATRGLTLQNDEPVEFAALRILRAEIFRSQGQNQKALEDCEVAIRLHKQNPEWYILRSDLHRRLQMKKERVAGVEEGVKETGAGILDVEQIEALMDASQFAVALMLIDAEMNDSRIKSSWLIRRARAEFGLGNSTNAEADLKAAVEEIDHRLHRKRADVLLLVDKATALELLGDKKAALSLYEEAQSKGGGEALTEKIKALQESMRFSPAVKH